MKEIMPRRLRNPALAARALFGALVCYGAFELFPLREEIFDEQKIGSWNFRKPMLGQVHFVDDRGIRLSAFKTVIDPVDGLCCVRTISFQTVAELAAEGHNFFGDLVGERHFVRVPAWDSGLGV